MRVKIFTKAGVGELGVLEREINEWLTALPADEEAVNMHTSVAATGGQGILRTVVTVWVDKSTTPYTQIGNTNE